MRETDNTENEVNTEKTENTENTENTDITKITQSINQEEKADTSERSSSIMRFYFHGLTTGVLLCIIIIFVLQISGILPKFIYGELAENVRESAEIIESTIDKYYWKEADKKKMADGARKGLVAALGDKYSSYFTKEELEEENESIEGIYTGMGITISPYEKENKTYYEVTKVHDNGTAKKAGIKQGDILLEIDGIDISTMDYSEFRKRVRSGSESIKLKIEREENKKKVTKEIEVKIEKIVDDGVEYKIIDKEIAYISVSSFSNAAADEFIKGIDYIEKNNAKGLIIDLRDNGGGSLEACVKMLNRMLPKGNLLTEKTKINGEKTYESDDEKHYDKPVIILINGKSASASEVFSGAMQDRKKASLVGEQSFGKGIMQSVFAYNNKLDGGIKLTTGEYLLPSGRSIHGKGLTPDKKIKYTGKSNEFCAQDDNQYIEGVNMLKELIKN